IAVHPEVEAVISVTVARSEAEAERINRGEDISTRQEDQDAAAEAIAAAGEFFDPEAQHDEAAGAGSAGLSGAGAAGAVSDFASAFGSTLKTGIFDAGLSSSGFFAGASGADAAGLDSGCAADSAGAE